MYLPIIIYARGGSKRVPRKNIRPFCGKSLVEWAIIAAEHSKLASEIILTTDDDEIATVGERHKIRIFRRPTMSDETPGSVPVFMALKILMQEKYFEEFITMSPTAPLRLPEDLDNLISLYYGYGKPKGQGALAVIFEKQIIFENTSKSTKYIHYKGDPSHLKESGLMGIDPVELWLKHEFSEGTQADKDSDRSMRRTRRLTAGSIPYIVKRWQYVDVDFPDEFDEAEWKFQKYILDKGYYK